MQEILRHDEELLPLYPKYVFVLGAGLHGSKASEDGLKLSWQSRMRLTAAADIFKKHKTINMAPEVILTGGNVYNDQPPLSWIGRQKLVKSHQIPQENITSTKGRNTLEEFEIIESFMSNGGILPSDVVVISNDFHLVAKHLAQKLGIHFLSAENVLTERHRNYQKIIRDIQASRHYQQLKKTQKLYVGLLNIFGEHLYKIMSERRLKNVELTAFDPNRLKELFGH